MKHMVGGDGADGGGLPLIEQQVVNDVLANYKRLVMQALVGCILA